jgi:broad specificity phosphatase PhoE
VLRVLLVRHAECEDNVVEDDRARRTSAAEFAAFVAGAERSPLTAAGGAQARALAARLRGECVARVYASPLPRARETASILAAALGLAEPTVVDGLRELVPRPPRGGTGAERTLPLRRRLWPAYARMLLSPRSPDRLPLAVRRLRAAWRTIADARVEGAVVAVGHGWATAVLLWTLRLDPRWRVRAADLATCGVSVVERRRVR